MPVLPKSINDLIEELGRLPGVGPRTAERYAFYLFKQPANGAGQLAQAITSLHGQVKICPLTFMLIDAKETVSPLYSSSRRDKSKVLVVEEPLDVAAIESTGSFDGTYHVLGGTISPIDGVGPEQLHIAELISRLKTDKVNEVILATNPSVEGESTALFVQKRIKEANRKIKVTRLATGLPAGVDIEYADHITLTKALEGRRTL
ncbi:MAG TPA: recombination mediator RecR [Candidatus Saccharimonadales bacterium]